MNHEELNQIIHQLEAANSKDEAYFAIQGNPDERYANANKSGLQLMAAQFLIASIEFDDFVKQENRDENTLFFSKNWSAGNSYIDYIEPVLKEGDKKIFPEYKQTLLQKIYTPIIIFSLLILIVGTFITGIVTVISWFV